MTSLVDLSTLPWEHTAQHRLRFLVVGGSIAGLACAYALQKAGHGVEVFERSDGTFRSPAVVRCPPQQARILRRWGVNLEALAEIGGVMASQPIVEGSTGKLLQTFEFRGAMLEELSAEFFFFEHGDLYDILRKLAVASGATLHFNADVTHVDAQRPSVLLASGETVMGDIIIGADGRHSAIRSVVTDEDAEVQELPRVSFTMQIPEEMVRDDDEIRKLVEKDQWKIWNSDNQCVYVCHVPSKREYGVAIITPAQPSWNIEGQWDVSYPLQDFNIPLTAFEPALRRLISLASTVTPVPYITHTALSQWVSDTGTVLLAGDAASPYPGFGGYGASCALEDADVLGALFSRLRHAEQVPALLAGYEEMRPGRAAFLARCEMEVLDVWCARDAGKRWAELDQAEPEGTVDAVVAAQWAHFIRVCGYEAYAALLYDARETAEDWLAQWSGLLDSDVDSDGTGSTSVEIGVAVVRDEKVHYEYDGQTTVNVVF